MFWWKNLKDKSRVRVRKLVFDDHLDIDVQLTHKFMISIHIRGDRYRWFLQRSDGEIVHKGLFQMQV